MTEEEIRLMQEQFSGSKRAVDGIIIENADELGVLSMRGIPDLLRRAVVAGAAAISDGDEFGHERYFISSVGVAARAADYLEYPGRPFEELVEAGLLSTRSDPAHKQKTVYSLTEPAIQLVPLLAQMGAWGRRFTPATRELSIRAQLLEEGGPPIWEAFMAELRSLHLGTEPPERSVIKELTDAYPVALAG